MANIKKSFNFRNGVQVDNDNFIVNPNGLVGIGSTIPTESLDVQGNIRLRGTLYADDIETGSITNTSDTGAVTFNLLNVGITSIKSGIITASSGIVTYYGDGSKLQGLPTSQWVDVDPALNEYTSIYAVGNVGIATTNPIYTLQIGGNYSIASFANGVGIASEGDIRATRDVTVGRNLNVTGISTIGSNLNIIGIATIGSNLNVIGIATIGSNLNVIGITTSYSFSGFGTNITGINASNISNGTLSNDRLSTNINKPTGIATFNVFNGSLVGIATTARGLTTDANIDIISIISDISDLGITTSSSLNVTNSLGVGTNNPNSDIHIRRIGSNAELQVTSDSNTAQIIIGKDVTLTSNNTIIKFNDTSGSTHPQSGENCFDIINYAPGNFNSFIRPQSTPNLKFNWINHSTNAILMSLTSDGNLGLGKTNPSLTFEVVGTSTITSNSFVGGDFSVSGSVTGSSLTINGSSTLRSTTINGAVGIFANSPNYTLQIGDSLNSLGTSGTGVGISSSGNVVASGIITASKFVGIGSDLTLLNPSNISSGTISNISINSPSGTITSGIITASKFVGIGSDLTLLNPSNISSGTISNISINSPSGVVTSGILTATTLYGNGSNITSLSPSQIQPGTIANVSINSIAGVVTAGIVTANKIYGNGSSITLIDPANISSGTFTGSYSFSPQITIGDLSIYSNSGTFTAQIGVSTEIDRYNMTNSLNSIEYFISVQKSGKVQSSKVLISSIGSTFAYSISTTVSVPNSIVSIGISSESDSPGSDTYLLLNVTPTETGSMTYKYARHLL